MGDAQDHDGSFSMPRGRIVAALALVSDCLALALGTATSMKRFDVCRKLPDAV